MRLLIAGSIEAQVLPAPKPRNATSSSGSSPLARSTPKAMPVIRQATPRAAAGSIQDSRTPRLRSRPSPKSFSPTSRRRIGRKCSPKPRTSRVRRKPCRLASTTRWDATPPAATTLSAFVVSAAACPATSSTPSLPTTSTTSRGPRFRSDRDQPSAALAPLATSGRSLGRSATSATPKAASRSRFRKITTNAPSSAKTSPSSVKTRTPPPRPAPKCRELAQADPRRSGSLQRRSGVQAVFAHEGGYLV